MGERRSLEKRVSEIHEGASILLRANYGTSKAEPGKAREQYAKDSAQGKEQEKH